MWKHLQNLYFSQAKKNNLLSFLWQRFLLIKLKKKDLKGKQNVSFGLFEKLKIIVWTLLIYHSKNTVLFF